MTTDIQLMIQGECADIANLLCQKNEAYGNSVFEPMHIFHKGDWLDAIHVRIDDKLARLARGQDAGEDVVLDLIGYLVLKRVGLRLQAQGRV